MESAVTKDVLFAYFAGSCTAFQKRLVADWVKSEENRELFFLWLYEWERKNVQYVVDVEAGIERHRNWVNSLEEPPREEAAAMGLSTAPRRFFRFFAVASVILAAVFSGWLARDLVLFRSYHTGYGEIRKLNLPDGSRVVLNANSELRVPRFSFGRKDREVFLGGEASFQVVHTPDYKRFRVKTLGSMAIEVLGTSFNVYSRSSGTKVVLQEGKVRLRYKDGDKDEALEMKPGDLATMDPQGNVSISRTDQPHQYSSWKFHRFVFENLTFREITERLEEVFGTKVLIESRELADELITGSFMALDAEELLDLLSEAQDFTYKKAGDRIVISVRPAEKPVLLP